MQPRAADVIHSVARAGVCLNSLCENLGQRAEQYLKQWTHPVAATLVTGALADMTRSRADLIAENAMLR